MEALGHDQVALFPPLPHPQGASQLVTQNLTGFNQALWQRRWWKDGGHVMKTVFLPILCPASSAVGGLGAWHLIWFTYITFYFITEGIDVFYPGHGTHPYTGMQHMCQPNNGCDGRLGLCITWGEKDYCMEIN